MFIEQPSLIHSTMGHLEMINRKVLFVAVAAAVTSLSFMHLAHAGPRLDKIMDSKIIRVKSLA